MSRKIAPLFVALALVAGSAGLASAEPVNRPVSERVSYADLDLSSTAGVKVLKLRLDRALDRVCGKHFDSASMTVRRAIRACRKETMHQTLASIGVPALTTAYLTDPRSAIARR
jgi:UrcA family protein